MTATKAPSSKRRRLRLPCIVDNKAADDFRSLPMKERERLLAEFREICAPAFSSVAEYLALRNPHG